MSIDRVVLALAGTIIIPSLLLSILFTLGSLLLAAVVGLNLLRAAFIRVFPLAMILERPAVRPGAALG